VKGFKVRYTCQDKTSLSHRARKLREINSEKLRGPLRETERITHVCYTEFMQHPVR